MLITHEKDKLLNSIIYFIDNTEHCHLFKLYKLLFILDFEHFKQTGHSVTGQIYRAGPGGPVPDLHWKEMEIIDKFGKLFDFDAKFDNGNLTRRQLQILGKTAINYRDKTSSEIMNAIIKNYPWYKDVAPNGLIPYEIATDNEDILEMAREYAGLKEHYSKDDY